MKIAFIVETWPSKNEIPLLNQVVEINKQGHDATTVFTFNSSSLGDPDLPATLSENNLLQNINLLRRPALDGQNNRFLRRLKLIIKSIPISMRTFIYSPTVLYKALFKKEFGEHKNAFKIVYAIQNLLGKENKFDYIICQFAPLGIWGAILKNLGLLEGELVTVFRGYGINDLPRLKPNSFYDFLIENCHFFTSNTKFTKNSAIKLGFPADKIHVVHSALNTNYYAYRERKYDKEETFEVLTIAALREVKGLEYAIKAVKILVDAQPDLKIRYRIAGDGVLRDELGKLIKKCGLGQQVQLLGFVNHDEVAKLYEKAHLFVLPSIKTKGGNQEAQGLVMQEAQACGVPVIGTRTGGIPEGFIDDQTGFLVNEKSDRDIADKIGRFLRSPELIPEFGKAGRSFVETNFDVENESAKFLKILVDTQLASKNQ